MAVDLSHMFDDSESTCVLTASLIQSRNQYFAQLNIYKYQVSMESRVGLRVKFSTDVKCIKRQVVGVFLIIPVLFYDITIEFLHNSHIIRQIEHQKKIQKIKRPDQD